MLVHSTCPVHGLPSDCSAQWWMSWAPSCRNPHQGTETDLFIRVRDYRLTLLLLNYVIPMDVI